MKFIILVGLLLCALPKAPAGPKAPTPAPRYTTLTATPEDKTTTPTATPEDKTTTTPTTAPTSAITQVATPTLKETQDKEDLPLTPLRKKKALALFARIPVLHGGRVKPLSTFSKEHLMVFYGGTLPAKVSAEHWLAELLLDPQTAGLRKIFKISNPDIKDILELPRSYSVYSFKTLSKALDTKLPLLNQLQTKAQDPAKPKELSLIEKQILQLYQKANLYLQLSHSLSLVLPLFSVPKEVTPGMAPNKDYNYLDMLKFRQSIKQKIKKMEIDQWEHLPATQKILVLLAFRLDQVAKDENNNLFKIIPPQWKDNKELWYSPWELTSTGKGSPSSARYIASWEQMAKAYGTQKEQQAFNQAYHTAILTSKGFAKPFILHIEKIFNDFGFFKKSLWFYIMAFFMWLISCLFSHKTPSVQKTPLVQKSPLVQKPSLVQKTSVQKASYVLLLAGGLCHGTGLLFRMLIMGRPPVATLYESILFVAFIVVVFSLIVEHKKREGWGLLTGSILGTVLGLLSLKYQGIESMELLVPVLNTNFWLATHVLCITTGYGFAILSSVLAHVYLSIKCFFALRGRFSQSITKHQINKNLMLSLKKNMQFCLFLALFFCLFGTVLGGIWADQSWGRFWGWDPKENGALLIVLSLLAILHGKQAGLFKEDGLALGLVLCHITVALSWFGVNLLGVGLHSYGFVSGALYALMAFCAIELIFFIFCNRVLCLLK